jgi:geranylgeranyl reductase family protein
VTYDAIVVGAGPAGSTCAYHLSRGGASVLLLDRARFPRDKPCGGGVTVRALDVLPVSIQPVIEEVVTIAELRLRYGRAVERGSGKPLAAMTQRRRLDAHLVEEAVRVGAELRDGTKVQQVEAADGRVAVTADGERLYGRALIGADGVNGVVGRTLGLGGNQAVGVALEGNVPWGKLERQRYTGRLVMELAILSGGYGWVFPKGDHANVGVGGWEREAPKLRASLGRLCSEHGIAMGDLEDLRGFRLPLRSQRASLARGRALLVGDAGGLIDPLSGDGMYEAFLSSKLAAEAVSDVLEGRASTVEPYGSRLTRALAGHLFASWGLKVALDRFPRATFALAKSRPVWGAIEKVVRGELADVSGARGLARPGLKALGVLGRAAGNPGQAFREA